MENEEEISDERAKKISIMSQSLLHCVMQLVGEDKATPHEMMNVLCNTFWGMILVCSGPKDVAQNIDNAFGVLEETYKMTKKSASEMAWKHFADMNGVGNS